MAENKQWSEEQEDYKNERTENQGQEEQVKTQQEDEGTEEESVPLISDEELEAFCRERICPECPEKKEKDKEMLLVKADAENFRKRMAKEKEQFCKYANENLLQDLLPVIDNLELATEHGRDVEACSDLIQGIDMTIKIFLDTLKKHGLEKIEISYGQEFDPTWHEAMGEMESEDLEGGRICQVLQKGYKLKDRLLRPAKVMVSKKT